MKSLITFVLLLTLIAGCRNPIKVTFIDVQDEMLLEHNFERNSKDIHSLETSTDLQQSAQAWAERMARRGRLVHGNTFKKPQFNFGGENIAWGQKTVEQAMSDWMSSNGHRRNILSEDYTHAGFGCVITERGDAYWCAQFGGD